MLEPNNQNDRNTYHGMITVLCMHSLCWLILDLFAKKGMLEPNKLSLIIKININQRTRLLFVQPTMLVG